MHLHLGADLSVYAADVVAILDYNLKKANLEFIDAVKWDDNVYMVHDSPKSMVITYDKIYMVAVSRSTLTKRWNKQLDYFRTRNFDIQLI